MPVACGSWTQRTWFPTQYKTEQNILTNKTIVGLWRLFMHVSLVIKHESSTCRTSQAYTEEVTLEVVISFICSLS